MLPWSGKAEMSSPYFCLGRDAEYVGNSSSALVVVGGEYSGKYGRLVDEEMVVCVVLDEGVEFSGNLHGIWRT